MVAEVRRDIADFQPTVRIATVRAATLRVMRAPRQPRRKTFIPAQTFLEHRTGVRRFKTKRVRQIAVSRPSARIEFERFAETCDCRIKLSGVLVDIAERVVERRIARILLECPVQRVFRIVDVSQRSHENGRVIQGDDRIGAGAERSIVGSHSRGKLAEFRVDVAEVDEGVRIIGAQL